MKRDPVDSSAETCTADRAFNSRRYGRWLGPAVGPPLVISSNSQINILLSSVVPSVSPSGSD